MTELDEAEEGCITEEEESSPAPSAEPIQQTLLHDTPTDNFPVTSIGPSASSLPYETGASNYSNKGGRRPLAGSSPTRSPVHRQHHNSNRTQNRHMVNSNTPSDSEVEVVPSTDVFGQSAGSKPQPPTSQALQNPQISSSQGAYHKTSLNYSNEVITNSVPQEAASVVSASHLGQAVRVDASMSNLVQPLSTTMPLWMPNSQPAGTQPMMVFVPTLQGDGSMTLVPTWTTTSAVSPAAPAPAPPLYRSYENSDTLPPTVCAPPQTASHVLYRHMVHTPAHPSHPHDSLAQPVPDAPGPSRIPPPPPPPPPLIDPYAMTTPTASTGSRERSLTLVQNVTYQSNSYAPTPTYFNNRGAHQSTPYTQSRSHMLPRSIHNGISWNPSTDVKPLSGVDWSASHASAPSRINQDQLSRPPPPPTAQDISSRQSRANEFHCTVCDRDFRHKNRYDLHLVEDHVPCEQCEWTGPPTMLLAHNLNHLRGKDGEVICKSKIEEETWLAARRKKREIRRMGGDPRKAKVPMSELEAALRESLKVRRTQKMRLSANLLRRQPRDAGVLPQAHAYTRMFQAKRTESYEGPEIAKSDQCRIWQEFNICHSFLRHKRCKFGRSCSRSHDIKRYQDWYLNRIKSGIQVKFRHYNAKALLYTLAAPEIAKYERTLLKCFKVLVQNKFWLESSADGKMGDNTERIGSIDTDATDETSSATTHEDEAENTLSNDILSSPQANETQATTPIRQSDMLPVVPLRQGSCGSPLSAISSSPIVEGKSMAPSA